MSTNDRLTQIDELMLQLLAERSTVVSHALEPTRPYDRSIGTAARPMVYLWKQVPPDCPKCGSPGCSIWWSYTTETVNGRLGECFTCRAFHFLELRVDRRQGGFHG